MIEFDEFLDILWDVKHAKGNARGLLFSRAGVFLEGTLAAAQRALRNKRQQMRTPLSGASGLGGISSHGHDDTMSSASHASHATNSTAPSSASGEQPDIQEQPNKLALRQRNYAAMIMTTPFSAAMTRGKEAALSILPKLSGKTIKKWRGLTRTQ